MDIILQPFTMERKHLATIEGNGDAGCIILMAKQEHRPDHGTRWHIVGLLPDGAEEDTETSTIWGGTLSDAVECIEQAWGADVWRLKWIPSDEELGRMIEVSA